MSRPAFLGLLAVSVWRLPSAWLNKLVKLVFFSYEKARRPRSVAMLSAVRCSASTR